MAADPYLHVVVVKMIILVRILLFFSVRLLFYSVAHTDVPDGVKNWVRKVAQNNESWNFCVRM